MTSGEMRLDATFVSRAERGSRHRSERGAVRRRNGRAPGQPGPPLFLPLPPRFPALSHFCAFFVVRFGGRRGGDDELLRADPPSSHESFERRVSPAWPP